ncbi:MAG: hypothetical protein RL240_4355 [Planctomycetota bacterium]|jgi:hypothetical protein
MAKCDQGYLCRVCGKEVDQMIDSELYLRFIIGEIDAELLHLSPECHLACNPTLSQFIDDERFSKAVQAPEGFRIVDLDPRYVELRISLVSRGYRRLWEIRKERSRFPTIQAYPLDQHGDEKPGQ